MDPAKEEPLRSAMEMQGVMLGRHEEELSAARLAVEDLTAQVTNLSSRLLMLYQDPSADPRRYPLHEPRINNPPCYAGEPTECRAFLTQCEVVFSLQPQTYAGDPARIAFVLSLLMGRAREWGTSAWEARTSCCGRYELFKEEMIKIFDRSVFGREASHLLTTLHQGRRSVTDFAIEFRTLATTCEWNELARFFGRAQHGSQGGDLCAWSAGSIGSAHRAGYSPGQVLRATAADSRSRFKTTGDLDTSRSIFSSLF